MNTTAFYPPSPAEIPNNFTKLPNSYKIKAFLAILAVIIFFLLYGGLIAAMGWLLHEAVVYPIDDINTLTIFLKIGAVGGAGMLLAFTLKFIFKLKNIQPENRIKVDLEENPKLKEFVLQICKETGAPKPKHVYVDPDVNAYVSYSNMWLSLLFPTRKNLTIGFGLVSCLNMTEFKAVVAHEFGHFAQRSMKIGSYIISANTIIHDMIYTRDSWDKVLDTWRGTDIRLAAIAWIITPIIWIVRQVLALFYQFLNLVYSSLSREMEFNADKVAISTTGSEAIVSSLWKLDHGAQCWTDTVNHAYLASQKDLGVQNIYHQNNIAYAKIEPKLASTLNELPNDERGGRLFFESSEHSKVGMYASHPPNDHRENNAKTPFIACEMDERSAWELFDQKELLQEQLTQIIYKQYLNKRPKENISTEAFQSYIKAESAGKELLEEYHNTFADRYVNPPSEEKLIVSAAGITDEKSTIKALKERLPELMKPVNQLAGHLNEIQEIASGVRKQKAFYYQDTQYKKRQLQTAFEKVLEDRENLLGNSFKEWDNEFFAVHYKLAKQVGQQQQLIALYNQHNEISIFYLQLMRAKSEIYHNLDLLQNHGEITEADLHRFGENTTDKFVAFNRTLNRFKEENFVPLPNLDTLSEFKSAIIDGGLFLEGGSSMFKTGKFDKMMQELEMAVTHLQRIDQRSMASILKFHHDLVEKTMEVSQRAS